MRVTSVSKRTEGRTLGEESKEPVRSALSMKSGNEGG
jgi:hypothetical protein